MTAAIERRIEPKSQGGKKALDALNALGRRAGMWDDRALCREPGELARRGVDLDDFFPEVGMGQPGPRGLEAYARAKSVCADCPVAWFCLSEHRHEVWGVWGGTTPEERKVLEEPNPARRGGRWVRPKAGNPLAISAGGPRRTRAAG